MKNLSIKARLMVLALVPILVIVALSVGKILFDVSIKANLLETKERIHEVESLAKAIHFMQIERGLSVGFAVSNGAKNSLSFLENPPSQPTRIVLISLKFSMLFWQKSNIFVSGYFSKNSFRFLNMSSSM